VTGEASFTQSVIGNPLVRRLLHVWWRFSRGLTLGVRAIVIDEQGHICLVRHTYVPGWHLPGGGVEPGETLMDALTKELREEAGVELAGPPQWHGMFFNDSASSRDHVAVYIVRGFTLRQPHVPDAEIAEMGFFPVNALPAAATMATRRRLAEALHGEPISDRWSSGL
jgi:ADP-ribose pyrophosphatase YjhB (NUDIX family)